MAAAISPTNHQGGPGGATAQRSNTTRPFSSFGAGSVTDQKERPSAAKAGSLTNWLLVLPYSTVRSGLPVTTSNAPVTVCTFGPAGTLPSQRRVQVGSRSSQDGRE